jgi:hypothetical protein
MGSRGARAVLGVLALGACGRIDFDPQVSPDATVCPAPRVIPKGSSDLTGDGIDDLVVASIAGTQMTVWIFAGGPGFAPTSTADAYASISDTAAHPFHSHPLEILDWTRDGKPDLLLGTVGTSAAMVVVPGPIPPGPSTVDAAGNLRITFPVDRDVPSAIVVAELDGDGRDDVAISFWTDAGGDARADGIVAVYSDLATLGTTPFGATEIYGATDSSFGAAMARAAPDVTGDGHADLLVGAPTAGIGTTNVGGGLLYATPLVLGTVSADTAAFAHYPGQAAGEQAAAAVALADVDGDGIADVVEGRSRSGAGDEGALEIHLGPIAGSTDRLVRITGASGDEFGSSLDDRADLDGDGVRDLLVQGYDASAAGVGYLAGVIAGASPAVAFVIEGDDLGAHWGGTIVVGDFDADGRDDFAVGSSVFDGGRGRVQLFFGTCARSPRVTASAAANVAITGVDATGGFGARFGGH